jgi:hypothetical protein
MLLGVGMMLGMFAWSGFRPSFSPVANAATAEVTHSIFVALVFAGFCGRNISVDERIARVWQTGPEVAIDRLD